MSRPSTRAGMTLIEALIAITILAIVTTMIWGGFAQTARNKEAIEADMDRYHVIRAALDRMSRELSMAYVSVHLNPSPSMQTMVTAFEGRDHGDDDRVDFTSFSHQRLFRDAHESDQNEISYFLTHDPSRRDVRVLARREQNRIDDDPGRGGRVEVLVEDVTGLQIEYLDPLSGQWLDSWSSTQGAGQPNRLPSQVKILLTVPDPRGGRRSRTFGTRATIPLTFALNHAVYNP